MELSYAKRKIDDEKAYADGIAYAKRVGLRDPGKRTSCPSNSVPSTPGSASGIEGADSGALSSEATEFLLGLIKEADGLRNKFILSRDYIDRVKAITSFKMSTELSKP